MDKKLGLRNGASKVNLGSSEAAVRAEYKMLSFVEEQDNLVTKGDFSLVPYVNDWLSLLETCMTLSNMTIILDHCKQNTSESHMPPEPIHGMKTES